MDKILDVHYPSKSQIGWMDRWVCGWINGLINGWVSGWMGECVFGWVGWWLDGLMLQQHPFWDCRLCQIQFEKYKEIAIGEESWNLLLHIIHPQVRSLPFFNSLYKKTRTHIMAGNLDPAIHDRETDGYRSIHPWGIFTWSLWQHSTQSY